MDVEMNGITSRTARFSRADLYPVNGESMKVNWDIPRSSVPELARSGIKSRPIPHSSLGLDAEAAHLPAKITQVYYLSPSRVLFEDTNQESSTSIPQQCKLHRAPYSRPAHGGTPNTLTYTTGPSFHFYQHTSVMLSSLLPTHLFLSERFLQQHNDS